jgi:uncharacterized membrane protein
MKTQLTNLIVLTGSLVFIIWYLRYIQKFKPDMNAISKAAKFLPDGQKGLVFLFIAILCASLTYVAQTLLMAICGGLLFMIGVITGHNPDIKNQNIENFLHGWLAKIGVAGGIVQAVLFMPVVGGILAAGWFVFSLIIWKKRWDRATWWIEVTALWVIYPVLFIEKVILL